MTPGRRSLAFADIPAIVADVNHLVATPHRTVGHWSLGQILEHLAVATRRLVDAPASTPFDPALLCTPEEKQRIFASGQLPEGLPLPATMPPPAAVDAEEQAAAFRSALDHYQASPTGPVLTHRILGPLTRDEWDQLVRLHAAHHLSFVVPTPN